MNNRRWLVDRYGEEKMREAEEVRDRLVAYKNKIQPYDNEPRPVASYIPLPSYEEAMGNRRRSDKLAEEARVMSGATREIVQEHVSHIDKKRKSSNRIVD